MSGQRQIPEGLRHALALWHGLFSLSSGQAPAPTATAAPTQQALRAVHELVRTARVDTVYADLYLQRARELLASQLDEATYRELRAKQTEAANLPNQIRNAIDVEAWDEVHALCIRLSALNRTLSDTEGARAAAQEVYDFEGELVDPFSPGLSGLAGVLEADLPALRDEARNRLDALRASDPEWSDLYQTRAAALAGLKLAGASKDTTEDAPPREQAVLALTAGDFGRLEELSSLLASQHAASPSGSLALPTDLPDLTQAFSAGTLARAARMGLFPVRVESTRSRVTGIYQHAWRPTLGADDGTPQGSFRIPVNFAPHTPAALRERLELYLNRPLVNSGGARNLPYLVKEDALVETFDEPAPSAPPAKTALLEALGLPARNGLSRNGIERALLAHGLQVVRDLELDPRVFRLVCIPSDLHVRIGHGRGWGTQPIWTHLDGWMVLPKRKFLALAGGDVRFGGIYDLVGVGSDYDSEHLFARFAVVLRRRMSAW